MKFGLMLVLLLAGQMSFAQTMREKRIKEEMLTRTDTLISKVDETRAALKVDDVVTACEKINELFEIYPDHVKAIGSHMDLFSSKTVTAKNDSLAHLIFVHQQSLICKQGRDCEYLDIGLVDKQMKAMKKSLDKQKKTIKKGDTDFDNSFYYEYEF